MGAWLACSETTTPAAGPWVHYHFEPDESAGSVQVTLTVGPASPEGLELKLPPSNFGPATELARGIEIEGLKGATLETTGEPETHRLVWPHPNQNAQIRYKLSQLYAGPPRDRIRVFWPALQPDYWYFSATTALISPAWEEPFHVTVSFAPPAASPDWKLLSSRGVSDECDPGCQVQFEVEHWRELHADVGDALLFMVGRISLHHETLFPNDEERRNELYLAIYGLPDYAASHEALVEALGQIIRSHQEFWDDPGHPFFAINIVGFDNETPNNFGGFNASQTFTSFAPRHAMTDAWRQSDRNFPHTDWVGLLSHISHEYGHTWISPEILDTAGEPIGSLGWLVEGSTEYRADRVLLSAGLIDMARYVQRYNEKLHRYDHTYRSARSADLDAIAEGFWTGDYAIQRQPYLRGNLLAHDWNARMVRRGVPEGGYDGFLLKLVDHARQAPLRSADIFTLSEQFLEPDLGLDVEKYWFQGHVVPLEQDSLGPCFQIAEDQGTRQFQRRSGIPDSEWEIACLAVPRGWPGPTPHRSEPPR